MEAAGLCVRTDRPAYLPAALKSDCLCDRCAQTRWHLVAQVDITHAFHLCPAYLCHSLAESEVTRGHVCVRCHCISECSPHPPFISNTTEARQQYKCAVPLRCCCVRVYFSACKMSQLFQMLRDDFLRVYDFWIVWYMLKLYLHFFCFVFLFNSFNFCGFNFWN